MFAYFFNTIILFISDSTEYLKDQGHYEQNYEGNFILIKCVVQF